MQLRHLLDFPGQREFSHAVILQGRIRAVLKI
jgi:hypothetical protein